MWKRIFLMSLAVGMGCTAGFMTSGSAAPALDSPRHTSSSPSDELPQPTGNWTLQEREYWQALQQELDELTKKAQAQCQSGPLSASYVQESFRGKLSAGGNYGLDSYTRSLCTAMIHAVIEVCTDGPTARQAIGKGLRRFECEYGKQANSLAVGTFHVTINKDNEQYSSYYRPMVEYLRKHL